MERVRLLRPPSGTSAVIPVGTNRKMLIPGFGSDEPVLLWDTESGSFGALTGEQFRYYCARGWRRRAMGERDCQFDRMNRG